MATKSFSNGALERACACRSRHAGASCRDAAALAAFQTTGRCQRCQDEDRLGRHPSEPSVRYPVRSGAVAAMSVASGLPETVFIPFRWTVPCGPFAWDTTCIVRVGALLAEVDWVDEWAGAMSDVLHGHHFAFHRFERYEDPALRPLLGDVELLIGVNVRALVQVHRCLFRVCPAALCIGVDTAYESAFGHPLGRLGAFVASNGWTAWNGARAGTPSALRLCSWIGALLSMRCGEGARLFDVALESVGHALGLSVGVRGPGFEACAVRALDPC